MLSHRIIFLRKKTGISQADLARALRISPSTVGMYEQGRRIPDLETLIAMSRFFDVSLDYLITGAEHAHAGNWKRKKGNSACGSCYWKVFRKT